MKKYKVDVPVSWKEILHKIDHSFGVSYREVERGLEEIVFNIKHNFEPCDRNLVFTLKWACEKCFACSDLGNSLRSFLGYRLKDYKLGIVYDAYQRYVITFESEVA